MPVSCEQSNGISGFMKDGEILDNMCDDQLVRKDSGPWSQLVVQYRFEELHLYCGSL